MQETKEVQYRGRAWTWPADDTKLVQVIDQVGDLQVILEHVRGHDVCVQAGGACGVWPAALAEHFRQVYTFEPDQTNFACLVVNLEGIENVAAYNLALGERWGHGKMALHESEQNNAGAGYVVAGDDFEICWIDNLVLDKCDLIQLDVEGMELQALKGAERTLRRFWPVVVIEEKALPQGMHEPTAARQYLEDMGYREVARAHRDVIFAKGAAC